MDPIAAIILANSPPRAEHLLVIDVPELVPAAVERADRVSVWCDDIRHARQLPSPLLLHRLDAAALSGVDLVWLRLPKALGALDEYAELVAGHACAAVRLVAGGREKHLNRTMNRVLGSHFGAVAASLGQRKSRALLASDPIPAPITWPRRRELVVAGQLVDLHWHGATFAAGRIDAGTQLLIDYLESVADADRYLDLGSGSGVLATLLARRHPQAQVHAVDASWAAVDASRLTSAGTGVEVHWACDLAGFGNGSLDVVVCNRRSTAARPRTPRPPCSCSPRPAPRSATAASSGVCSTRTCPGAPGSPSWSAPPGRWPRTATTPDPQPAPLIPRRAVA